MPRFVAAILLGSLLPGCPLSDAYFVDPNATQGSGGAGVDRGGTAGIAGSVTSGGTGSQDAGGTGGTAGTGGREARGGRGMSGASAVAGSAQGGMGAIAGSSPCEPMERCDGLDNDCNGKIDDGSACPESCSAQQYDGHAYVLCMSDAVTADEAAMQCMQLSNGPALTLELAWIESSAENDFLHQWIVDTAPSDGVVWMGANDLASEGTWVWGRRMDAVQFFTGSDSGGGSPYMGRFNYFGKDQPGSSRGLDEDCGAFDARVDWHWSDRECSESMVGFVCEEHAP